MKQTLLLLLAILMGCSTNTRTEHSTPIKENDSQPLAMNDLEGNPIDLSAFGDTLVFINFWATWCAPCIKEMPSLEKMEDAFSEDPIVFYYASNESPGKIKAFKQRKYWDINYTHLQTNLEELGIYALPTTIILGKDKSIVFSHTGSRKWDSKKSIEEVKALLK